MAGISLSTPLPLNGEILGPSDVIRVIGAPHPLKDERIERVLPAGLTVAELVSKAAELEPSRLERRFIVHISGEPVPEDGWHRVRPKPGTTLTFRALVEGGQALRSIAMIAVAALALVVSGGFAAPFLGSAFAAGTFGAAALGAAIPIGGTLSLDAFAARALVSIQSGVTHECR